MEFCPGSLGSTRKKHLSQRGSGVGREDISEEDVLQQSCEGQAGLGDSHGGEVFQAEAALSKAQR